MNPSEARRRIDAIRADQAHPFFAESHPGHRRAVRDMEALYAQAYPESATENPFDQPVQVKAAPPADPGLKHREPGVFWQPSARIPQEELQVAQERTQEGRALRRAAAKDFVRDVGKTQNDIAMAEYETSRAMGRGLATVAQGIWYALQNWAEKERQGARDFDVAYKVSRMGPEEKNAYIESIAAQLRQRGEAVPDDLSDRLLRFDPNDPTKLTPGYFLNSAGQADFYRTGKKNIASDGEGPSFLGGLNDETKEQRWHQRDINRNGGMTTPREPPRRRP